jgi:ATP phosphoribosyltransferase
MLRVAVPNKGRLAEDAALLLKEAGYYCQVGPNELTVRDERNHIEFFFIRPKDIPAYVTKGVLDLGITGRDLALEGGRPFTELMVLEFGKAWFRYAVPEASPLTVRDFQGLRIATSYPNLVREHLRTLGIEAQIIVLDGAVEISIQLGIADAIADVVQSGRTMKAAGLKIIGDPLVTSEAILLAKEKETAADQEVAIFSERLKGIITARKYMMIEYDIPKDLVDRACAITPGIESPTIAPLNKQGWLAIKAMVKSDEANRIMDQLKELGGKGILVTRISSCRL